MSNMKSPKRSKSPISEDSSSYAFYPRFRSPMDSNRYSQNQKLSTQPKKDEKDKLINLEKVVNGDEYNDENVTVLDLVVEEKFYNEYTKSISFIIVYYVINNNKYLIEYRQQRGASDGPRPFVEDIDISDLNEYNFSNLNNLQKIDSISQNYKYGKNIPIILDINYKKYVDDMIRFGKDINDDTLIGQGSPKLLFYGDYIDAIGVFIGLLYIQFLKNIFDKIYSTCLFILDREKYDNINYQSMKINHNYIFSSRLILYDAMDIYIKRKNNNYILDYKHNKTELFFNSNSLNKQLYVGDLIDSFDQINPTIRKGTITFSAGPIVSWSIHIINTKQLIQLVDSGYKYTDGKGRFYKLD